MAVRIADWDMRVSIPICIASCLAVVVLTWWLSTRSREFLTAPSEAKLEQIRLEAAQTNPTAQGPTDALSPVSERDEDSGPIPVVLPEHVEAAPQLDDYRKEAKLGPDYLMELARLLSAEHPERALTCWERVLDSTKADEAQMERAAKAVIRLKKTTDPWTEYGGDAIPIVIEIGTGPTAAQLLNPVLNETAEFLNACSSGVLEVSKKVSVGSDDMIDAGRSPVAMWISGPNQDGSRSTDVVSFFIQVDTPERLHEQIHREILRIVRHHLSQMDDFQPLPKPSGQYSTDKILEGYVTRMVWKDLAKSLQKRP